MASVVRSELSSRTYLLVLAKIQPHTHTFGLTDSLKKSGNAVTPQVGVESSRGSVPSSKSFIILRQTELIVKLSRSPRCRFLNVSSNRRSSTSCSFSVIAPSCNERARSADTRVCAYTVPPTGLGDPLANDKATAVTSSRCKIEESRTSRRRSDNSVFDLRGDDWR